MARLSPFRGWLVRPEAAPRVVAPAYDAMTAQERQQLAASEPDNFLNVMRSPADQPDGASADRDALLAASRATLDRLVAEGAYGSTDRPAYHVLRMRLGDHTQTGIVATVPVRDLGDRVRPHEETRTDKEDELVRHLEVVGVSSSPIGLVHRGPTPVPELVDEVTRRVPSVELRHADGLQEWIWTVTAPLERDRIRSGFAAIPALYLTDGHHRAAAAQRFAARQRAAAGAATAPPPDAPWDQLLVVAFPETDLQLLPYHRVVVDLGARTPADVVAAVGRDFDVEPLEVADPDAVAPTDRGTFCVHIGGRWYAVRVRDGDPGDARSDPVSGLDVTLLQERILARTLGIADARTDPRLEFVPGTRGLAELARRAGPDGAAFAVPPPDLRQLMAVADAGQVMPPKSTWFEPKLRSGVFLRSVGPGPSPSTTP